MRPTPKTTSTIVPAAAAALLAATPAVAASGSLQIFPDPEVVGLLIVFFAILILPVNKLLFDPLLRVLDERREQIDGARARSDSVAKEADDILSRYEVALTTAREEAETDRRQRVEEARKEQGVASSAARERAEGELNAARGEVEQALTEARGQLRQQAELLAQEAASRVLGRSL